LNYKVYNVEVCSKETAGKIPEAVSVPHNALKNAGGMCHIIYGGMCHIIYVMTSFFKV